MHPSYTSWITTTSQRYEEITTIFRRSVFLEYQSIYGGPFGFEQCWFDRGELWNWKYRTVTGEKCHGTQGKVNSDHKSTFNKH
jgi:hypothetical protein